MDLTSVDFEWIGDLHKSQCFTFSRGAESPTKSTDLGAEGYTASLTDWHELLQLTAPDPTCGVVFMRGQFPGIPESILARAQIRDDADCKGIFGTRLCPPKDDSDLHVGERIVQGWANFKWPYAQYDLKRKDEPWDASAGTIEEISFVRNGTYFHVMRIRWGRGSTLSDYNANPKDAPGERETVRIKCGGVLHFGCTCSNGLAPDQDSYHMVVPPNSEDGGRTRLNCRSSYYRTRLEMQIFVNGIPQILTQPLHDHDEDSMDGVEVDLSSVHEVELTRHEPMVIVSTYALRSTADEQDTVKHEHFENLPDYLGVSNASANMTDRLWTALCSTNYDNNEAVELSCVGRAVEQILSVASVPFAKDDAEGGADAEPVERALVHNIITPQYVDVQSAFYQLRLLVKAYTFIDSRYLEPDLLERFCPINQVRDRLLEKLRGFILTATVWLVNTDMTYNKLLMAVPSWTEYASNIPDSEGRIHRCYGHRERLNIERSYNQACYATLAVWYVMKNCHAEVSMPIREHVILPRLNNAFELVQHRAARNKDPTAKNDLLQWLHLSCLYLLCGQTFKRDENGAALDGFQASGLEREEVQRVHQRFEKYASRLKTPQSEAYTVYHEELDRLHLLAEELGLGDIGVGSTSSLVQARAKLARRGIRERKRTTLFRPGPKQRKGPRPVSSGPWELLATNHESYLRVADDFNLSAARDRLFHFMMADYTFMASWDRADSKLIGKWWSFEPTSIICATLLDLKFEGKLRGARALSNPDDITESVVDLMASPQYERGNPLAAAPRAAGEEKGIREVLLELRQTQEEAAREQLMQLRQLVEQAERGSNPSIRPYDWMVARPSFPFHPRRWVQSLLDTPFVYLAKKTKNVPLRKDIVRYLISKERLDIVQIPEYTLANIAAKLPPDVLRHFAVFDIRITSRFTFETKETSVHALFHHGGHGTTAPRHETNKFARPKLPEWYSTAQLESYRRVLLDRMNDSLVDLGVKHRILFSKQCSPELLGAWIYLWHPDALDTIDDYFGTESAFFDGRETMLKWVTGITIAHWTLRPEGLSKTDLERFDENRSNGDFPPLSVARLGIDSSTKKKKKKKRNSTEPLPIVDERSSSLVITGDPRGYVWICSMWSSVTDSEAVAEPIAVAEDVLHRFINRQGPARCLVFLVLLGHLCEKIATEYETVLLHLDDILGLGDKVLLEGLEWGTTEAVNKLKKMLWGLEALRVFNDRLTASLSQIQKAQDSMERYVKQDTGQLHVDLLQEFNNVSEEFGKRHSMLVDVQIRISLKIKQVAGLRDGISTVANVEDSQTTIRQGDNIRILTYITIAYLPLSFVAGLFSISHATFMDTANNLSFALLVSLFTLGTYIIAFTFESIVNQLSRLMKFKFRRKRISSETASTGSDETKTGIARSGTGASSWLRKGLRRPSEVPDKISRTA